MLGTGLLVCAIVGAGYLGSKLSAGNPALTVLVISLATSTALGVAILTLGPVSGGYFNPAVTIADALQKGISWADASVYVPMQILGGIIGAVAANVMFSEHAIFGPGTGNMEGGRMMFAEFIATFG